MCRLLGLIRTNDAANVPSWFHLVGAPNSLRIQAEKGCVPVGAEPGHLDSWGVGWFDSKGEVSLVRNTGSAADSAYFVFAAETASRGGAGSGPAQTVIGHLRKASVGTVNSDNAHPVRVDYRSQPGSVPPRPYDSLLVAHNGTIYKPLLDTLREDLEDTERAEARADSDTVLLSGWLANRLDIASGSASDTFDVLAEALHELFERARSVAKDGNLTTSYTAVNLLMAHPTGLYALRQFSLWDDYYTLNVRPLTPETDEGAAGYLVASERTDENPGWVSLAPGVLTRYAPNGSIRTMAVA